MAKRNPHLQLTVTPKDVEFGRRADAHTAALAEALETHPLRVARRKADEASIPQGTYIGPSTNFSTPEQRSARLTQALEKGLIASPAIGTAALSSGAWLGPAARMVVEGTKNPVAIAAMSGIGAGTEMLEDKPSPLGAAAKAAQWAAMARMPISEALAYVPEAEAGGGGLALLRKALTGQLARDAGTTSVIKNKGGNWLSGSVEGALSGLKKRVDPELEGYFRRGQNMAPGERAEVATKIPINDWVDKQLTRYVNNEMATPEDPVRALAERGVLHITPPEVMIDPPSIGVQQLRKFGGFSPEGLGKSELAKQWEVMSDRAISNLNTAGGLRDKSGWLSEGQDKLLAENPWLMKLPEEARVHEIIGGRLAGQLGFDHLIDELSNALNPESGLPRHLLLDPASLPRVSVPQAVERVAKINEWRAAQKAEADALRANNAATVLHKEYPEKGMKWVELKINKLTPDQIQELKIKSAPKPGAWKPDKLPTDEELAYDWEREALADALKYEGDTMGHCVGGYCDDVASGRSRIYSLRDAKGQPHVTIEVVPQYHEGFDPQGDWDKLPEELQSALMKEHGTGNVGWTAKIKKDPRVVAWEAENMPAPPDRIVQIKGKQNRAPNEEYLPFVQDFVKSGKWSDVGDLQNTGLRKAEFPEFGITGLHSRESLEEALRSAGVPDANISGHIYAAGFASGGQVRPDWTNRDIINAIYQELQHG